MVSGMLDIHFNWWQEGAYNILRLPMAAKRVVYSNSSCVQGALFIARRFGAQRKNRDVACFSQVKDSKILSEYKL